MQPSYLVTIINFTYHLRYIPEPQIQLEQIDHIIDNFFIPSLTNGHTCSPDQRKLIALHGRFGGLGILIILVIAKQEMENSQNVNNVFNEEDCSTK